MKARLLIVDDDEIVLSGLAGNLEEMGYGVRTAASAADALAAMLERPADLVLTDLVMEGADGLELLRRLRDRHPAVPVIIITGHGTAANALEAVRHGAADYIQKPARSDDIAHRVDTVLAAQQIRLKLEAERDSSLAREALRDMHLVRSDRLATALQLARGLAGELKPLTDLLDRLPQAFRDTLSPEQGHRVERALSTLREIEGLGTRMSFQPETIRLNDVVASALDTPAVRAACDAHPQVSVDTQPGDAVPPVSGSPSLLRKSVAALVSAMVDSFDGGGRLNLTTGVEHLIEPWGHYVQKPTGVYTYVLIRSTLRADEESIDRMFEPYAKSACVGPTTAGLALTRIVLAMRALGGLIQARSDSDLGMEIRLLFPVPHAAPDAAPAAEPAVSGRRVLVVDDASHHRDHSAALLRDMGCEVDVAGNSEGALRMIADAAAGAAPYDVVVLDLVLGEAMDGLDLMRQVHAAQPAQRVVLMGGFADTARIAEARKSGAVDYLRKPLARQALSRALRLALPNA